MPRHADARRRTAERGLTLTDLLAIGLVVGLVTLLLPAVLFKRRETSHRPRCKNNLRQISVAAIAYMTSNYGPANRKGFLPHVRALDQPDGPEDVGVVFQRLVNIGEIDDPEVLICSSSLDVPERIVPVPGEPDRAKAYRDALAAFAFADTDVRTSRSFSYGWAGETRTDGNSKASDIIIADRSVQPPSTPPGTTPTAWRPWNHVGGRNVARFDGSVDWLPLEAELQLRAAAPGQTERIEELNVLAPPLLPSPGK